jgi:hypothetical protein
MYIFFENAAKFKYLGTKETKIAFTRKLTAESIRGILAAMKFRIFCLPVCYVKT